MTSILLALAVDAWWDRRQDREDEATELAILVQEFDRDLERIDTHIANRLMTRRSTRLVLDAVRSGLGGGERVNVPDTALMAVLLAPSFEPATAALEGLIESGRLGLISDRALRSRLAAWPQRLADSREEEEKIVRFVAEHLSPILREHADVSRVWQNRYEWWRGNLSPDEVAKSTPVRPSTVLASALAERLSREDIASSEFRDAQAELERLLRELRAHARR